MLSPPGRAAARSAVVAIDDSLSMRGFLSFPDSPTPDALNELTSVVATSPQLGSQVRVAMLGNLDADHVGRLKREDLSQPVTNLEVGLTGLIHLLDAGAPAVVLATDLVGTTHLGAIDVIRPLSSLRERRRDIEVFLFGVQAPYWGVASPKGSGCSRTKTLGCRFSEYDGRWLPLQETALVPLYFLVLARDQLKVHKLLASLEKEAKERDWRFSKKEQLVERLPDTEFELRCEAERDSGQRPQRVLLEDAAKGTARCARDQTLLFNCPLEPLDAFVRGEDTGVGSSWAAISPAVHAASQDLGFGLDCRRARQEGVSGPLVLQFSRVRADASASTDWSNWHTVDDRSDESVGALAQQRPGKTLRLAPTLEAVRYASREVAVRCQTELQLREQASSP